MIDLDKWERDARFVAERLHSSQLRFLSVEPEAVLALVAEVRAARKDLALADEAVNELGWALADLLAWAKRDHGGDRTLHPEEWYRTSEHAQRVLDDYAKTEATGEIDAGGEQP